MATIGGSTREQVLAVAAALEARCEHPLARALLAAVDQSSPAGDVQAIPGAGLTGTFQGRTVRLGRPGWLDPGALEGQVMAMQEAGATAVLIEDEGRLIGAIAVRDELRPEAREVVAQLTSSGYAVAMLTGDNTATATALAAQVGISDVHADLRPENKARIVADLSRSRPTAMVGDGVNDAPALATAGVGIAMGAMGTDVAIETADVALMGEDLRHLPQVLDHARRSRHIMLQNIGLSLAIVTTLIPLAGTGILGLAAVVFIHEVAEVVVIANGVRAGRAQPLAPYPAVAPAKILQMPADVGTGAHPRDERDPSTGQSDTSLRPRRRPRGAGLTVKAIAESAPWPPRPSTSACSICGWPTTPGMASGVSFGSTLPGWIILTLTGALSASDWASSCGGTPHQPPPDIARFRC